MKKNHPESPNVHGPEDHASEDHTQARIVFGTYQTRRGKGYVKTASDEILVEDVKQSVSLPIKENSPVKALIRRSKKNGNLGAYVLRITEDKRNLNEHVERLLLDAQVPIDFDPEALAMAQSFGASINTDELKSRRDLSHLTLCTIDGETAKDFDDAVYAHMADKDIEIVIAIADVSHYVAIDSPLDRNAMSRGTSIYYPGHCVPMLPEHLSNGLCSLKPREPRLALAVSFTLGPLGGIKRARIEEVVINSAARLTYNQVQKFYDHHEGLREPNKGPSAREIKTMFNAVDARLQNPLKESLLALKKAAHILRKGRMRRGAIDFDVTESVVALDDQGEPMAIHPQDRLEAHRIIEDLMVATNEIVAEYFSRKGIAAIYRVHEAPDKEKLSTFLTTAQALSALPYENQKNKKPDYKDPKTIQDIMAQYQRSKYKDALNTLMLRSMMQARYSAQNLMHFGLASKAYLHFTSPIRRYADLMVHRQLRYYLFDRKPERLIKEKVMGSVAQEITEKEIKATDLERKIDRLYSATFMQKHLGQSFDAVIVSVVEFGMFVRVVEHHVEGLVHIATISRSYVEYLPERLSLYDMGANKNYMVGDKIRVKLINVNVERGHIDFELIRNSKLNAQKRARRKKRRQENAG